MTISTIYVGIKVAPKHAVFVHPVGALASLYHEESVNSERLPICNQLTAIKGVGWIENADPLKTCFFILKKQLPPPLHVACACAGVGEVVS